MFTKILIANRGEIACRVIKHRAPHGHPHRRRLFRGRRRRAPRAPGRRGRAASARRRRASPTWSPTRSSSRQAPPAPRPSIPGYGFLSENEDFAEACAPPTASSSSARRPRPSAPWARSRSQEADGKGRRAADPGLPRRRPGPGLLRRRPTQIGYPVLIKAAPAAAARACAWSRNPSEDFPDAGLLQARGDLQLRRRPCAGREIHHQAAPHRDPGLRRHPRQLRLPVRARLLGAAPPPEGAGRGARARHDAERRARWAKAAVAAAKAVGYVGAGTVEFIANQDGSFYFMEMNTRLQVEHPVTEMITGQDLVEWQLRVAAGEPLPLAQEQLQIAAMRSRRASTPRIPARASCPRPASWCTWRRRPRSLNVRVDTGVEEGDEITPALRPDDRQADRLGRSPRPRAGPHAQALADYRVVGVTNNIDFLSRLVACPAFAGADLDTGLIEREKDFLFPAAQAVPRDALLVATSANCSGRQHGQAEAAKTSGDPWSPWHARDGWRMNDDKRHVFLHGATTSCAATTRCTGRSRRRPRRRPDRADAGQGRRPARPARPESREGHAAADPRSDENGTHHHRPPPPAPSRPSAISALVGEVAGQRWRGAGVIETIPTMPLTLPAK
jgi:3-methylcrotonyl-CoA carboxylase alpha subunit